MGFFIELVQKHVSSIWAGPLFTISTFTTYTPVRFTAYTYLRLLTYWMQHFYTGITTTITLPAVVPVTLCTHHPELWREHLHVLKAGVDAHEDVRAPAHQHDPQRQIGVKLGKRKEKKLSINVSHMITQTVFWAEWQRRLIGYLLHFTLVQCQSRFGSLFPSGVCGQNTKKNLYL